MANRKRAYIVLAYCTITVHRIRQTRQGRMDLERPKNFDSLG
jgi:hypothetical protein